MSNTSLRLILILQKIPREPNKISTKEIIAYLQSLDNELTISPRSIQRDMEDLCKYFPIITTAREGRGKEGVGWAFSRNAVNTGVPGMEPTAALTLLMAMAHLQQLFPKQILSHLQPMKQEAENVLSVFNKRHYEKWPDKIRIIPNSVLKPAPLDEDTIGKIYQALLDNKQFLCTYNHKQEQRISPLGIVQRGNTLYLLCRFADLPICRLHRYSHYGLASLS